MGLDVAVLRGTIHGMPRSDLAAVLRERLPEHDVTFAETPAAERAAVADAEVVVSSRIDEALLDVAEELRLFACLYAGTDHLPMDALEAAGVAVTSAAGVHASNVGEHAVGALLALARGFGRARRQADRGEWRSFRTRELHGSTVTVVGLGHIGTAVAERLEAFGVETIGVRHSPEKGGPTDEVLGYDEDLHAALARSRGVVLAAPLTETTRGIVDREAMKTMPPDAVVVNVGRGPLVDTEDLVAMLRRNAVGGAALDVTDPEPLPADHPLWDFEDVLITPHNAGHTPAYFERVADILAENLQRVEATGRFEDLENQVI